MRIEQFLAEAAVEASGNTKTDAEGRTFIYDSGNKQVELRDGQNAIVGRYFYNDDGQRIMTQNVADRGGSRYDGMGCGDNFKAGE